MLKDKFEKQVLILKKKLHESTPVNLPNLQPKS